jgi:predicted hotdog family 3-hydroxylacyl-ACP dehydratase
MQTQWSIDELLPQSGTMILIDDVVDWGEGWARSSVRIAEDSAFYEPGHGVPSWVGIEFMAQTVAMYIGICARQAGEPIRIGLLLGTRRFETACSFYRLGSRPTVHVQEVWRDEQMAAFECRVEDRQTLASATLNLFQPKDAASFVRERAS